MYGGKIENGKIIYRENSETYPQKDGYMEHEYKEVIDFFLQEDLCFAEYERFIRGESDQIFGRGTKPEDRFTFSFSKERPSHIKLNIGKNERDEDFEKSFSDAKLDRIHHWSKILHRNEESGLSPKDFEIASNIVLKGSGESELYAKNRPLIIDYSPELTEEEIEEDYE